MKEIKISEDTKEELEYIGLLILVVIGVILLNFLAYGYEG